MFDCFAVHVVLPRLAPDAISLQPKPFGVHVTFSSPTTALPAAATDATYAADVTPPAAAADAADAAHATH